MLNLVRHEPMSSWLAKLAKPLACSAVAIAVAPATKDTGADGLDRCP